MPRKTRVDNDFFADWEQRHEAEAAERAAAAHVVRPQSAPAGRMHIVLDRVAETVNEEFEKSWKAVSDVDLSTTDPLQLAYVMEQLEHLVEHGSVFVTCMDRFWKHRSMESTLKEIICYYEIPFLTWYSFRKTDTNGLQTQYKHKAHRFVFDVYVKDKNRMTKERNDRSIKYAHGPEIAWKTRLLFTNTIYGKEMFLCKDQACMFEKFGLMKFLVNEWSDASNLTVNTRVLTSELLKKSKYHVIDLRNANADLRSSTLKEVVITTEKGSRPWEKLNDIVQWYRCMSSLLQIQKGTHTVKLDEYARKTCLLRDIGSCSDALLRLLETCNIEKTRMSTLTIKIPCSYGASGDGALVDGLLPFRYGNRKGTIFIDFLHENDLNKKNTLLNECEALINERLESIFNGRTIFEIGRDTDRQNRNIYNDHYDSFIACTLLILFLCPWRKDLVYNFIDDIPYTFSLDRCPTSHDMDAKDVKITRKRLQDLRAHNLLGVFLQFALHVTAVDVSDVDSELKIVLRKPSFSMFVPQKEISALNSKMWFPLSDSKLCELHGLHRLLTEKCQQLKQSV